MSSSSGWFTAKKRGRDDDQIARDAAQAKAARRRRRKPGKATTAANKKKKKKSKPLDDFVVDSSDEEEEREWEEETSEEEQVLSDHGDEEEDDSSDSDDEGFYQEYVKKKPPTALQKKRTSKKLAAMKKKAKQANTKADTIDLLSSDGEDNDDVDRKVAAKTWDNDSDDSSSSMASDSILLDGHHKETKSKHFAAAAAAAANSSFCDLEDTPPPAAATAARQRQKKKKLARQHKPSVLEAAFNNNNNNNNIEEDVIEDEDEMVAVMAAIEASRQEAESQHDDDGLAQLAAAAEDEEESDNGGDEGDEQEEYINEEAQAASSILATANELSAQILKTMASWASGAEHGMIVVDGALALTSTDNASTTTAANHEWISQDVMKRILPNVVLADYQLIGVNWLALLHGLECAVEGGNGRQHANVNGVLADEMGLGKTCQTIAFLSWLKHGKKVSGSSNDTAVELIDSDDDDDNNNSAKEDSRTHLVIAPASVLQNWKLEFEKFAPNMQVVKYHGSMTERMDIQVDLCRSLPDVILAPITYFQKEKSDDRNFLRKFKYDYLVVDEAHLLKNPHGTRYKTLDNFTTMHRLLLTGTPVQNSPKELMPLLCFLMPLFSRKMDNDSFDVSDKRNYGGEDMIEHFVSLQSGDDHAAYKKLKQLFSPFVLRRRKEDVLGQILPSKERLVEFVELDCDARMRYDSIVSDHVKAKKQGSASANDHLFTNLRKAAHHQLLLRYRHNTAAEKEHLAHCFYQYRAFQGEGCTKEKVREELEKFNDFDIHLTALDLIEGNPFLRKDLDRYVLSEEDLFCSAKFVRLRKLLPELLANGHRILIFSVWTSCLDLLGCLLEHMSLDFLRMDGSTAVTERQSLIDRFNRDSSIPIFLLSTKACGLGINLTAADVCIMHDLDFNPFNDLQAEDRCHRIGQKKPVTVIKMVTKATVDEDIYELQQRKAKMNAAIMENDADWNKKTKKDKEELIKTTVDRFLKSPNGISRRKDEKENDENVDDCDSI